MKLLDLCAGVGGFSYAAHRLGWTTDAFCERDEFCRKVLAKNFPGVPIYDDVYTFPGESFRGRIDVLTGGFPCQPFSQAGKRLGVNDERHLFPEILRIIREVQPAWVVLENVNGLTSMAFEVRDVKVGRTKYSRDEEIDDYEAIYAREETMLLNRICEEIEREGYAVQPVIVPAVSLEADHERKRIWIVARRKSTAERCDVPTPNPGREYGAGQSVIRQYEISDRSRDAVEPERSAKCNGKGLASEQRGVRPDDGLSESANRDVANADDAGDRTRESEHDEREQPQPKPCGHGFDASDTSEPRLSFAGHAGQWELQAETGAGLDDRPELNYLDALDTLPDAVQGNGSERDGPGPSRLRHRENVRWPANWLEAATRFCRVHDGPAVELDQPDDQDDRVERLKALGNMIYWPCAFEIFSAIQAEWISEEN